MNRLMQNKKSKVAICCDECAALVVNEKDYFEISSAENSKTYRAFYKNGEFVIQKFEKIMNYGKLIDKQ